MRHSLKSDLLSSIYHKLQHCQRFLEMRMGIVRSAMLGLLLFGATGCVAVLAQDTKLVLIRDGRTIVLEPYATNIVRVTLSKEKTAAAGAAGYGFVGTPSMTGWTHQQDSDGDDVFRSSQLVVHVSADRLPESRLSHAMPLDDL